jgi:hypothetical protein
VAIPDVRRSAGARVGGAGVARVRVRAFVSYRRTRGAVLRGGLWAGRWRAGHRLARPNAEMTNALVLGAPPEGRPAARLPVDRARPPALFRSRRAGERRAVAPRLGARPGAARTRAGHVARIAHGVRARLPIDFARRCRRDVGRARSRARGVAAGPSVVADRGRVGGTAVGRASLVGIPSARRGGNERREERGYEERAHVHGAHWSERRAKTSGANSAANASCTRANVGQRRAPRSARAVVICVTSCQKTPRGGA